MMESIKKRLKAVKKEYEAAWAEPEIVADRHFERLIKALETAVEALQFTLTDPCSHMRDSGLVAETKRQLKEIERILNEIES